MVRSGIIINGAKMRKARTDLRLSTKRLADLIGCSAGHVRLMERGIRKPSIDMLGKLEEHLGVTAEDLDAVIPV